MKDYRLTVKIRNNRLLKAIEAVGGTPGGKWCAANGLGYLRVNNLLNMTNSPLTAEGKLHRDAARLCEVLGKLPEDLWSNEQLYPLERNFSEMEMDHAQVVALLPPGEQSYLPDFSGIEQEKIKTLMDRALSTLTPREEAVIRMRFHEELTLDEVAKRERCSSERVRQIEASGMRKLRAPKRIGLYVDALDMEPDQVSKYKNAAADWVGG